MKFLYVPVFILILLTTVYAANIFQPSDFEYGFKVDVPQSETVYGFILPAHFYDNIKNADASDLLVFNADNEQVPFALRQPAPKSYIVPDNQSIPFFIINEEPYDLYGRDKIAFKSGLIIDLSSLSQMPSALKLNFAGDKEFNASVEIYLSSTDLNSWRLLSDSVNITQLRSAGNTIIRDTIELPALPLSSKYIKIETYHKIALQDVSSVYCSFSPMPVYEKAELLTVESVYDPSSNRNSAQFDTKGHYPVEWIHFDIPPSYLFPDFTISARDSDNESWQTLRYRAHISRYPLDTSVNGIAVQNSRDRYWQLTTDSALPAQNNSAVFYWRADELIFIAKGAGPYTVAYGRSGFKPSADIVSAAYALRNSQMDISSISPDIKPVFIGTTDQDTTDIFNIKNYLLVGVTLLVVAALTLSAIRLIMDVNKKNG